MATFRGIRFFATKVHVSIRKHTFRSEGRMRIPRQPVPLRRCDVSCGDHVPIAGCHASRRMLVNIGQRHEPVEGDDRSVKIKFLWRLLNL